MSKAIEHCLEAYENKTNWRNGNYKFEYHNGIGKIYMFGNLICLLLPDGGRLYSHCGYKNHITTKKVLGALDCNWRQSVNLDLEYIYQIIIKKYGDS